MSLIYCGYQIPSSPCRFLPWKHYCLLMLLFKYGAQNEGKSRSSLKKTKNNRSSHLPGTVNSMKAGTMSKQGTVLGVGNTKTNLEKEACVVLGGNTMKYVQNNFKRKRALSAVGIRKGFVME